MIYVLFMLIVVAIFYFKWVASGMLRKFNDRLDKIDSDLGFLINKSEVLHDRISSVQAEINGITSRLDNDLGA